MFSTLISVFCYYVFHSPPPHFYHFYHFFGGNTGLSGVDRLLSFRIVHYLNTFLTKVCVCSFFIFLCWSSQRTHSDLFFSVMACFLHQSFIKVM
jgi:hypothetical protein